MDIKSTISTPVNLPPPIDDDTKGKSVLLAEQFRLEREIADQSSIKTQDSFVTTYSSLQIILSQMQVKLASVFLQETEYLQQREQRLEDDERSTVQRMQQLKMIQNERKQLEKEFSKLQDRIEAAVVHLINFRTDGEEILRLLFSESRQIDEDFSAILSQSLASFHRCRSMIYEKIDNFSQRSDHIQSALTDRETLVRHTQSSINSMLELMNTLNELNIEHSQDITMAITDFEKQYQTFIDLSETTKCHRNISKEMNEIRALENEKLQLEQELCEQIILLENINTIIGKAIVN